MNKFPHEKFPHAQPINDVIVKGIHDYIDDAMPDRVDVNDVFAALQAAFIHFVRQVPLEHRKLALKQGARMLTNAADIIDQVDGIDP